MAVGDSSSSTEPSIAFVVPFVGHFPAGMDLFVETCKRNPSVRWIVLSANEPVRNMAPNVTFERLSLDDLNSLISDKLSLSIQISPQFGYKLCDLRPAFGQIFEDYLQGYDFWGYCDLDMFVGDMRKFLTADLLTNADIVSPLSFRLNGPLTLLRNSPLVNGLWSKHPRSREIFTNVHEGCMFDEVLFSVWVQQKEQAGALRCHFDTTGWQRWNKDAGLHVWDRGRLFEALTGKEFMLFHYYDWKDVWPAVLPDWRQCQSFAITAQGPVPIPLEDHSDFLEHRHKQYIEDWKSKYPDLFTQS